MCVHDTDFRSNQIIQKCRTLMDVVVLRLPEYCQIVRLLLIQLLQGCIFTSDIAVEHAVSIPRSERRVRKNNRQQSECADCASPAQIELSRIFVRLGREIDVKSHIGPSWRALLLLPPSSIPE